MSLFLMFITLALCDYYREVNITYCHDNGRIIYANYNYFPLGREYKVKYKCRSKTMKHYNFYKLKQTIEKYRRN
jgi:hypothetical protein